MSELGRMPPAPETALPSPREAANVVYNPSISKLRELAHPDELTTGWDAPAYVSAVRSRSADRTSTAVDTDFGPDDFELIDRALATAEREEMICLDRQIGRHSAVRATCRYYVPRAYARIALTVAQLLEPAPDGSQPEYLTVQDPGADETAIRVFPDTGVTTVLGTDYSGEAKKSFLRLFMYDVKRAGGLGLHAGSKRVTITRSDGLTDVGQLFLGLSATGKSTLTAHDLDLEAPESAAMVQDDVCALLPDGTAAGSEGRGLYIKTHGLDPDQQPSLYRAATRASTVFENVVVDEAGRVDFDDDTHTANGRAVVQRDALTSAADAIDLADVSQVFFITRNPLIPPVAKLDPNSAAAAFMCGESIETSAGDPSQAGEPVRVVGTNPFIIGSKGAEGNRFKQLVTDLDLECYILNTGSVGETGLDVGVSDSVAIIRAIARGDLDWRTDPDTGYTVPTSVPNVDMGLFDVAAHVPDIGSALATQRQERQAYLDQFSELDLSIRDAV